MSMLGAWRDRAKCPERDAIPAQRFRSLFSQVFKLEQGRRALQRSPPIRHEERYRGPASAKSSKHERHFERPSEAERARATLAGSSFSDFLLSEQAILNFPDFR